MASLIGQPDLAPPICTYCAYFSCPKTDLFSGDYTAVLDPYRVDPLNAATAPKPASVAQQIFAAIQQGDPTVFLAWSHGGSGPRPRLSSTLIQILCK